MKKSIVGLISGLIAVSIWGGMYDIRKVVFEVMHPSSSVAGFDPGPNIVQNRVGHIEL